MPERERTILDDILEELRAARRERERAMATIADAQTALSQLRPLVEQLIAENQSLRANTDTTPLISDITTLQNEVQAALPAPPAPEPSPTVDPATGQQIDPNTGQPVQSV